MWKVTVLYNNQTKHSHVFSDYVIAVVGLPGLRTSYVKEVLISKCDIEDERVYNEGRY